MSGIRAGISLVHNWLSVVLNFDESEPGDRYEEEDGTPLTGAAAGCS
jgi:hypothetical protein